MITLQALCFGILGYLLGATPYGLIIARVFCHTDPRTGGSHNTGATNVARMCGFGWGVATLACDLLKGALPVFLAQMETGSPVVVTVAALSAVLGHVFSCFMNFKGGKAVATSIGVFLPIAFPPLLIACLLCLIVIWRTEFVSAGSLTLVCSMPILLCLFGDFQWLPLSLCVLAGAFHPNFHKRLSPLCLTLCCVCFGLLLPINAFFMCHYITKLKQINIFLEIAAVPAPHFNLFILNIHV